MTHRHTNKQIPVRSHFGKERERPSEREQGEWEKEANKSIIKAIYFALKNRRIFLFLLLNSNKIYQIRARKQKKTTIEITMSSMKNVKKNIPNFHDISFLWFVHSSLWFYLFIFFSLSFFLFQIKKTYSSTSHLNLQNIVL